MAYSNTVSTTVFTTRKVIDSAFRRSKINSQLITAEYLDIANDQLYLLLSALANQGLQLWCIEKLILPLYDGNAAVPLPTKTVDVLNSTFRTLQSLSGTVTTTSTQHTTQFTSATAVSTIGVKWSGASVPLVLKRSDDGATWTTIQTESPTAVAGEWTWFDIGTSVAATYFRIEASSGTLSYSQVSLGNMPTEIPLARLNRDDYVNLPNKTFTGNRVIQFWFDRQIPQPVMRVWPAPNDGAVTSQIVAWTQRYIMDVGTLTEQIEVPQRWYDTIVAQLAVRLNRDIPEADASVRGDLINDAKETMYLAQMEERDNSPVRIAPDISCYTR